MHYLKFFFFVIKLPPQPSILYSLDLRNLELIHCFLEPFFKVFPLNRVSLYFLDDDLLSANDKFVSVLPSRREVKGRGFYEQILDILGCLT